MSETEQLSGANDMYDDELDCVYEEGENEEVEVKEEEEEDSETAYNALEGVDQPEGNGKWWRFIWHSSFFTHVTFV